MDHTTVIARVYRDNTGVAIELPVILTAAGALQSLLSYLLEHSDVRSFSWMQKTVQVVGLLLDYVAANYDRFDDPKTLFECFVNRLYSGTIGEDGSDPSGLFWLPMTNTKNVRQLVNLLSAYSDWVAQRNGTKHLNPWRDATHHEERLNWAAWHQKHNRAFLAHTSDQTRASETAKKAKNVLLKRNSKVIHEEAKKFPDERIMDLLFSGFIVPGKQKSRRIEERLNLRDILITILMHFGGVRMSEPCHMFVHDVLPDPCYPERALVRIYHPAEGQAPDDWQGDNGKSINCNREAYLRGKYGMRPRTRYFPTSQMHAGWKGNALDSKLKYMYVHWFPAWGGELFLKLWNIFIIQRAMMKCDHPFAFVTRAGKPYSPDSFEDAFAKAVRRINLAGVKALGTTPHGCRHAYGQRLKDSKVAPLILMRAMHHHSIESQVVYTQPEVDEVTKTLNVATTALNEGKKLPPPDLLKYGFEDVDPLGLLSGINPKLKRTLNGSQRN